MRLYNIFAEVLMNLYYLGLVRNMQFWKGKSESTVLNLALRHKEVIDKTRESMNF